MVPDEEESQQAVGPDDLVHHLLHDILHHLQGGEHCREDDRVRERKDRQYLRNFIFVWNFHQFFTFLNL
jgi:hypothetical protein